jgi:ABC-type antimicrobial peptide transport system permease subunit
VGVSPNALLNSRLQRDTRPSFVLLAERQRPTRPGPATFYIRHDGAQSGVARDIGAALRDVDPRVAIVSIRSMDDDLESVIWPVRFLTRLLVLFAVVSVTIAALGQYAVIAFDVRRRTRDFGVRMALGASGRQIVREVLRQGFGWTAVGLATGFVLSVGIGRAGRALLFGVTSTDPLTYGGVFLMLAVISLAACYFPARRAARIDPMQVLRQE